MHLESNYIHYNWEKSLKEQRYSNVSDSSYEEVKEILKQDKPNFTKGFMLNSSRTIY